MLLNTPCHACSRTGLAPSAAVQLTLPHRHAHTAWWMPHVCVCVRVGGSTTHDAPAHLECACMTYTASWFCLLNMACALLNASTCRRRITPSHHQAPGKLRALRVRDDARLCNNICMVELMDSFLLKLTVQCVDVQQEDQQISLRASICITIIRAMSKWCNTQHRLGKI